MSEDSHRPRGAGSGRAARTILVALVALLAIALFVVGIVVPELAGFAETAFGDGIGLRTAAIIAFFLTVGLFVLLALVAGNGFVGELEVMIGAFFGFFTTLWLLIAWLL